MIISHKYKYIFLKTNKTAGTSIEIALSRFCGPDDVITRITPEDELTRRELGYPGPQNHLASWGGYSFADGLRLLKKRRRKLRYYNHIAARDVVERVGRQVFDDYFTFCFERNPWDRAVSLYYWNNKTEPRPAFSEFVESRDLLELKRRGFEVYTIDGEVVVDKICRFENLAEELESIRKQVGIPEPLQLPRAKSSFRKNKKNHRDHYSEGDKTRIAEMFADEIRLLGYEF